MASPYRLRSMQARYYDPNIGRFLSIDPVNISDNGNPNFFGRYHYAFNDPVNLTDPNGECPICIPIAIFIIKELAAEGVEQATGVPMPTVKNAGKTVLKQGRKQISKRRAKQLQANKAQGKKGEAMTEAKIGDDLAGKQVTLESTTTGKKARMDFVKKDKSVVETKTGNAQPSPNQADVMADIDAGKPVIPRGNNAVDAGLPRDQPVKLPSCTIDRPC